MRRIVAAVVLGMCLAAGGAVPAVGADLKILHSRTVKDVVVTILSESGRWTQGSNTFALEFTSASSKQPLDVGTVSLSTSMAMPGMAPMLAGATLSPDKTPGRYLGTISFADSGSRQVTVRWDGPAGKGTARFSVPVR
jgi:hypothetical protein